MRTALAVALTFALGFALAGLGAGPLLPRDATRATGFFLSVAFFLLILASFFIGAASSFAGVDLLVAVFLGDALFFNTAL